MWKPLILALCAALSIGNAAAQQGHRVAGPEGIALRVELTPESTTDSIMASLSEALRNYDNSDINVRSGTARPGDEIATIASPYGETRRLRNNVSGRAALGGEIVFLNAGAPLYHYRLVNTEYLALNGSARNRQAWCGANGSNGYCVVLRNGSWQAAPIRSDSPFAPLGLGRFVPANQPLLEADPTAEAELPVRTEIFRLVSMEGSRPRIAHALRIGDDVIEFDDVREQRVRLGSLIVHIEPGAEPGAANVRVEPMDPANYQRELLGLANVLDDYVD